MFSFILKAQVVVDGYYPNTGVYVDTGIYPEVDVAVAVPGIASIYPGYNPLVNYNEAQIIESLVSLLGQLKSIELNTASVAQQVYTILIEYLQGLTTYTQVYEVYSQVPVLYNLLQTHFPYDIDLWSPLINFP